MKDANNSANTETGSIRVEKRGAIGFLVLSQPSTLNALTLDMVVALHSGLRKLEADAGVRLIIIRSDSDRAFCAGGDMKRIRQHCLDNKLDAVGDYFSKEYALDLDIARCSKPYLALIDGIAMGGGLGVSVNGRFRVVTERAVLAMPETRIGFFPDVGASYFLPRLPQRCGYWLGLTSASVQADQAVSTGLATHHVVSSDLAPLVQTLMAALQDESVTPANAAATVEQCLQQFAKLPPPNGETGFAQVMEARAGWFADDDLEAIRQRLVNAATEDSAHLLTLLNSASPYSLATTCTLFRQAQGLDLAACLELEYKAAQAACRHADLVEGVRAVLVDKDRNPRWAE